MLMNMRFRSKKKLILPAVCLVLLIVLIALLVYGSGTTRFNRYSVTDFELGEKLEGVDSDDALKAYSKDGLKYFSDETGIGIENADGTARYYVERQLGGYIVSALRTSVEGHSVMSVGIGDNELDAKTLLLRNGFHMKAGGYNSCRALYRNVYVEYRFSRGVVYELAASIK